MTDKPKLKVVPCEICNRHLVTTGKPLHYRIEVDGQTDKGKDHWVKTDSVCGTLQEAEVKLIELQPHYTVKLDYFKDSGKFYSEGELRVPNTGQALYQIWEHILELQKTQRLPGLREGHSDFSVLINVPDHPHDHPHLLRPLASKLMITNNYYKAPLFTDTELRKEFDQSLPGHDLLLELRQFIDHGELTTPDERRFIEKIDKELNNND